MTTSQSKMEAAFERAERYHDCEVQVCGRRPFASRDELGDDQKMLQGSSRVVVETRKCRVESSSRQNE